MERIPITPPAVDPATPPGGRRLGDLPGILERIPRLDLEDAAALAEDLARSRSFITPPRGQ